LQWALENGCPWDLRACHGAVSGGHAEVEKWMAEAGMLDDYDWKDFHEWEIEYSEPDNDSVIGSSTDMIATWNEQHVVISCDCL